MNVFYFFSCDCFIASPSKESTHYENLLMQYTEIFLSTVRIEKKKYQKIFDVFVLIFAQKFCCGEHVNEYPQSIFWNNNDMNKNMYTPVYPNFLL